VGVESRDEEEGSQDGMCLALFGIEFRYGCWGDAGAHGVRRSYRNVRNEYPGVQLRRLVLPIYIVAVIARITLSSNP